jgi:hypothetical protein
MPVPQPFLCVAPFLLTRYFRQLIEHPCNRSNEVIISLLLGLLYVIAP